MPERPWSEVLKKARRVAAEVLTPDAAEVDQKARWPERAIRRLQADGLGGLVVPRAHGGMGFGMEALAEVCEVFGQACPSTALCFAMHGVGTAVLAAKPSDVQVDRYLRPIAQGRHWTTLALSEPGTGAHFYFPTLALSRDGEALALDGVKSFVTNGGHADSYVVSVAAGGAAPEPGRFSCVVVDQDTPGLHWGAPWQGFGMRGNSARSCELRSVRVGVDALLGQEGDQLWYVFNIIAPYFLMGMAGTYVGVAEAALGQAVSHLRERRYAHSGSGPAHAPVVQHRVGVLYARVQAARSLVRRAASLGNEGAEEALVASFAAKAEAGETAVAVANEAMTLMGGRGYRDGERIQRLLRDARAAQVMAPTTDILRLWAGRVLLGLPLLQD